MQNGQYPTSFVMNNFLVRRIKPVGWGAKSPGQLNRSFLDGHQWLAAIKTASLAQVVHEDGLAAVGALHHVRGFDFIMRATFAFALLGVSRFGIRHTVWFEKFIIVF